MLNLKNPGYLILSEVVYPGWKAYDNNKATDIIKSNKYSALYT